MLDLQISNHETNIESLPSLFPFFQFEKHLEP